MEEVVFIESCQGQNIRVETKIVRLRPDHCRYPVVGLPWQITAFSNVTFSQQSRSLLGANMQLFEFNVIKDSLLTFRITKPTTFLFFHLCGEISYFSEKGTLITRTEESVFYLAFGSSLRYTMQLSSGHHAVLGIALEKLWSFRSKKKPPEVSQIFDNLYTAWINGFEMPIVLPHINITKEIWRILSDLRSKLIRNIDDNIEILTVISQCLKRYHEYVVEEYKNNKSAINSIGEGIRLYLMEHYMFEEDCRLSVIRKKFGLTEWELRKIAKEALGCTIGQYLNIIRMEKSAQLLIETKMTINEITIRVGYTSPTTFTNSFRNKMGISPTGFRKERSIQN